jgi:hypothetical protein
MYLYLTCFISYDVNMYLDLRNINKFKFKGVIHLSVSFYFLHLL